MAAYSHMDEILRALADPSRRLLLDTLNERNGQTLRELRSGLDMARQAVSKHLAALEEANFVTTVRRGREKYHYLNAAPKQVVLESEPYRRLSYTWHTLTPEWAESLDVTDDARDRLGAERRSKVTFEIEPLETGDTLPDLRLYPLAKLGLTR